MRTEVKTSVSVLVLEDELKLPNNGEMTDRWLLVTKSCMLYVIVGGLGVFLP
jgi:hypothetical protein